MNNPLTQYSPNIVLCGSRTWHSTKKFYLSTNKEVNIKCSWATKNKALQYSINIQYTINIQKKSNAGPLRGV